MDTKLDWFCHNNECTKIIFCTFQWGIILKNKILLDYITHLTIFQIHTFDFSVFCIKSIKLLPKRVLQFQYCNVEIVFHPSADICNNNWHNICVFDQFTYDVMYLPSIWIGTCLIISVQQHITQWIGLVFKVVLNRFCKKEV